jgi:hypothetical protein
MNGYISRNKYHIKWYSVELKYDVNVTGWWADPGNTGQVCVWEGRQCTEAVD